MCCLALSCDALCLQTMKRFKGPATRLALIPGLAEAFYDGGIAAGIPVC
jgi:hypothetical protein